jgi:hypothetical protein
MLSKPWVMELQISCLLVFKNRFGVKEKDGSTLSQNHLTIDTELL